MADSIISERIKFLASTIWYSIFCRVPAIKISESSTKTPNPGYKQIWRLYRRRGPATADLLGLEHEDPSSAERLILRHPSNHTRFRALDQADISEVEPLLVEIMNEGRLVYNFPSIEAMRQRREADLARLDPGVRRIINPHVYHVSLTQGLWELKQELIEAVRRQA